MWTKLRVVTLPINFFGNCSCIHNAKLNSKYRLLLTHFKLEVSKQEGSQGNVAPRGELKVNADSLATKQFFFYVCADSTA
jgi:hypothetical protein